jgi:DNA-binding LytR/AlgR family response regulator
MKKINCLIIDDEPFALELIEGYVKKTPFLELKGKCLSAFDAMKILSGETIDLVFLDIQMPDFTGIDFSKTLPADTKIIFTTAFKEYAFEGFKVAAVDYLLKPFNYQEFLKAANKVIKQDPKIEEQKDASLENNFIFVKSEYKQIKISLDEVFYFESLKDYVKIWLTARSKPILTLISLKTLEKELPHGKFMRIHRSYIIALNKIESVERNRVIINNERITIAEQYKDKFQEFLENKSLN